MEMKFFYVGNVSDMSPEQKEIAVDFIRSLEYGIIATNNPETGARLSALNNLEGQTLKAMHFGTEFTNQKVRNIELDPRCEFMYTNANGGQIMLSGKAQILTDTESKRKLWQEWMNEFAPDGPEGKAMCIIRFTPEKVRGMIM